MRKLKDLMPGHMMYIILIRYKKDGQYDAVSVMKREITRITNNHLLHTIVDFHIAPIPNNDKFCSQILSFNDEHMESYSFKSTITGLYDIRYAFSADAFMEELKPVTKTIKQTLVKRQTPAMINIYYNNFISNVMKFIYSNESGFAEINLN